MYGEGDDKTWVEVGATKKKAEAVTGTDATQTTSPRPDERDASTGRARRPEHRRRRRRHRQALGASPPIRFPAGDPPSRRPSAKPLRLPSRRREAVAAQHTAQAKLLRRS